MYRCILIPKKLFGVDPAVVPLPVVIRLGQDAFESTLTSQDKDHYYLVVPVAYLRERKLEVGDTLRVVVEPDLGRKAPELPAVMARYFRDEPGRRALFQAQTIASQRQIVKYVCGTSNPSSQLNRLEKISDRLRELATEKKQRPPKALK